MRKTAMQGWIVAVVILAIALSIGGATLGASPHIVFATVAGIAVISGLASSVRDRKRQIADQMGDDLVPQAKEEKREDNLAELDSARLQRRALLKAVGVGALGAVPLVISSKLADEVVGAVVRGPSTDVQSKGSAARTSDGRIRQWAMVIDLRSCDGCQSQGTPPQCTTACIEGHFAPEPMEWIEVYESDLPGGGTQFIPTPCQQCQNPPCVNVCPVGATFSSPEGTVLIDQERCIGCRICMAACPYDRRFFNWGDPPIPPEALLADYSPDHQVPARRGTVMKCDFCPDMVRDGTLPYCVQACPNDAIWYGDLEEDIATNGRAIVKLSRFLTDSDAYRLKEQLGTEPRVFYIPGHGELVGRDPYRTGRAPTVWPWSERARGAASWNR